MAKISAKPMEQMLKDTDFDAQIATMRTRLGQETNEMHAAVTKMSRGIDEQV